MNSDRRKQVDSLQAVLERPPEERAAFLHGACAGDSDLEREVQSALDSQHLSANGQARLDSRQGLVATGIEAYNKGQTGKQP
jgi:hypothetical protein